MKHPFISAVLASASLIGSAGVQAQPADAYPNRPIRLVVPFPPGTASDFLGRTIGSALTELYKVQVVVDNRPGAGGLIGTPIVLLGTPDGYTLGLFGPPYLTSSMLQRQPPYNPLRDAMPIVEVAGIPNIIGVSNHLPSKSLKEFIAYAKARPGELNFASVGVGSLAHFGAAIVNNAAGLKAVHVPFKLLGDGWSEIFGGRVHYFVFTGPSAVPMVRENRARALAVSTAKRLVVLPDVPTLAEAGLPQAEHVAWFGLFAPLNTPRALVNKVAADVTRLMRDPQIKKRFESQGAEPVENSSPDAFMKLIRAENTRFAKIVKEMGIQPQ